LKCPGQLIVAETLQTILVVFSGGAKALLFFLRWTSPAVREHKVVSPLKLLLDEYQFAGITNKNNPLRPKIPVSLPPLASGVVLVAVPKPLAQQEGVWTAGSRVRDESILGSILQKFPRKFLGEFAVTTARPSSVANNINNTYIGNMDPSQYYCIIKRYILYYLI
jgi:hypothetical protein